MTSELKFTVAQRLGKSYLHKAYCTHPFKLVPVGENHEDPTLYVMIQSSSPGILDNDTYEIEVNLGENCRLNLQTQSYQRIFKMKHGAQQHMVVNMETDSFFHFIPHPIVPHENSIYQSRNIIHMAEGASLIWGEIITCGRKLSGEIFKFTYLRNILEVYQKGKLIFKDQQLLRPGISSLQTLGQLDQFTHQATLVYLYQPALISPLTDIIHEYFTNKPDLAAGVSKTAANGLVIRVLGNRGEQLFRCLQELSILLQTALVNEGELVTPI